MLDVLNGLLLSKKLQFEKGEIKLSGTNVCLIPPLVYIEILKDLQKQTSLDVVYKISKDSAKEWISDIFKSLNPTSKDDMVATVKKVLNLLAMGEAEVVSCDMPNAKLVIRLKNSLTASLYGKSDIPVDVIFSGYLAGAFSVVFSKDIDSSEVKCVAMGADVCEFNVE